MAARDIEAEQGAHFEFEDASSSDLPGPEPRRPRRATYAAAALAGVALVVFALMQARPAPARQQKAVVDDSVQLGALGSMLEVLSAAAEGVHEVTRLSEDVETSYHSMKGLAKKWNMTANNMGELGEKMAHQFNKGEEWRVHLKEKFMALNATEKRHVKERLFKKYNITSLEQLKPMASLHDGNPCADDEEELNGLCYKKCALINENFPFRVSAWECCQHSGPCPDHYKLDFRLCKGIDASGSSAGEGCPHSVGGCLKTEEFFGNFCYKRCSLITYGLLPARTGPQTCCEKKKAHDWFAFLDSEGCDTQETYFVGGGRGVSGAEMAEPHMPVSSLTEK